jgi:SAM-dependent methyltransferase
MPAPSEPNERHVDAVVAAQNTSHAKGHDYDKGSPHLRHDNLRGMVEQRLERLVRDSIERTGRCRVVEIGAGHGTFTRCLLDAGAEITVTEASSASAERLRADFGGSDKVEVIFDESGEGILERDEQWDLAVIVSVLHHIPDYLSFLDRLSRQIAPGGGIFTVQDPLFYPRMSKVAHRADRAAYLTWRLFQGDHARGINTLLRRLRGVYDDTQPSDLVEHHVVRDGVDEQAIEALLQPRFKDVEIFRYRSSQAPLWQRVGARTRLETTFGVEATLRLE